MKAEQHAVFYCEPVLMDKLVATWALTIHSESASMLVQWADLA